MNSYLTAEIPDPTDFPDNSNAPGLRALDTSLRCTICGELFDGPVTLSCGHCFCSICVRTSMLDKQECPACRKATNEGQIRPNPVIEEVVAAWKHSRPYVLQLVKGKQTSQGSVMAPSRNKKRKLNSEDRDLDTSSSTFTANNTAPTTPSKAVKGKQRRTGGSSNAIEGTIPTSDADEDELQTGTNLNPQPDDVVSCPLCAKAVQYKNINIHIDKGCLDPPSATPHSSKTKWSQIMAPKSGRGKEEDTTGNFPLPKASYATLKDRKLREMLAEHSLSTTGERNSLVKRHQQWVMIYNANLDKSIGIRRPVSALRKDLKKWEEDKARQKKTTVEDVIAHEKRHKDDFAQLIDVARTNRRANTDTRPLFTKRDNEDLVSSSVAESTKPPSVHRQISRGNVIILDSEEELELEPQL